MAWRMLYLTLLLSSTGFLLLTAVVIRRRQPFPGRSLFALLSVAIALWTFTSAAILASGMPALRIGFAKIQYIGIESVAPLWLMFVLRYTGQPRMSRNWRWLLWLIPVMTMGLAATNELHALVWSDIREVADADGTRLIFSHGGWFWLSAVYNYSVLGAGMVVLARALTLHRAVHRYQSLALMVAAAVPWLANLLYLVRLLPGGLDPTPLAFSFSSLVCAWALIHLQLLDLMPVARERLFERMSEGVIVIDRHGRVIDLNPASYQLLGGQPLHMIGLPIESILPGFSLASEMEGEPQVIGMRAEAGFAELEARAIALQSAGSYGEGRLLILRDVTAQRQVERELTQLRSFNERIIQQMAEGVALIGADRRISFANPAMASLLGYDQEALIGRHWREFVAAHHLDQMIALDLRRPESGTRRFEVDLVRADGGRISVLAALSGDGAEMVVVFIDMTERYVIERSLREANVQLMQQLIQIHQLQDELREQAIRDMLTGLYNRRYLEETLQIELARAARQRSSVGVVLIDLDRFKDLNDTHGHRAGDQMLQVVARTLQGLTRDGDVVCRYGGEEIAVVLAQVDAPTAYARAEQWRLAVEALTLSLDEQELRATISLGIALFPHDGTTIEGLLHAADTALYAAKSAGRNRVVTAAALVSERAG
jgi:diguanylate cyclase (GGDEF)-like protein/PAS domain S-box-containing protein